MFMLIRMFEFPTFMSMKSRAAGADLNRGMK